MVTVSIEGDAHNFVNESGGYVEVCMIADHDSQASYEVIITTTDVSATGKNCQCIRLGILFSLSW